MALNFSFKNSKPYILDCLFTNNTPIIPLETYKFYDEIWLSVTSIMDLHMEVGAAILILAEDTVISDTIFVGNRGYMGGTIFVNCKLEKAEVKLSVDNTVFERNMG